MMQPKHPEILGSGRKAAFDKVWRHAEVEHRGNALSEAAPLPHQ